MPALLLDPLHDARWQRLVDRAPAASVFHHPAWLRLLHEHYGHRFAAWVATDGAGEPVAGLPVGLVASRLMGRRLVALPFSDVCPPLVADGGEDALPAVHDGVLAEQRRRGVPLEVRAAVPELGTPVDSFLLHLLDLSPGAEAVRKGFHSRVRRNIRKAEREGVTVARRTDREALDAFFALHVQTRRRLGVPTQPRAFIRGLGELFAQGLGFVGLASHEGRPVSAAVFLRAGRTLTYKYGASDEAALALRPNNLVFADAIAWACGEGLGTLDFGRTDVGQEGLASFKRSWGAEERTLAYTYAGVAPPEPGHSRAEALLGAVIRRSPPVVSRLSGQLLYRHVV